HTRFSRDWSSDVCSSDLELYVLLLGRVLLGFAVGGFWTIGVALGPRLRPDSVGRATSIVFSGVTLGTVLGVPAGTLLGGAFGWGSEERRVGQWSGLSVWA